MAVWFLSTVGTIDDVPKNTSSMVTFKTEKYILFSSLLDLMEPDRIGGEFMREQVVAEFCNLADELYSKSRYGELDGKKFYYSLTEALYLLGKGKMQVFSGKKELDFDGFRVKAQKFQARPRDDRGRRPDDLPPEGGDRAPRGGAQRRHGRPPARPETGSGK